jgi:hypothetical protein
MGIVCRQISEVNSVRILGRSDIISGKLTAIKVGAGFTNNL